MRRNLLLASAACFFSMCAIAQTDYAPLNWKFSQMEIGSAEGLFVREMASTNWGCNSATFALGEKLQGSLGLACWGIGGEGAITNNYTKFTDEQKAIFEKFYNSCQIVDGGALGHLFCYQGSSSDVVDARVTKNTENMANATLFWLSDTDIQLDKSYRLSISWRVASKIDEKMKAEIATAAYDGIDLQSGLNEVSGADYRAFEMPFYSLMPDDWMTTVMDITIPKNSDPTYKTLPLVIKMWWGNGIEQGIVFLRDITLVQIDTPDLVNYVPGKNTWNEGWTDAPTGMSTETIDNQAIVWAKDGVITVVDAVSPIAVYSLSGQLIAIKAPMGNITTIPVSQKGAYIVRIGDSSRKVAL